MHHLAQLNIARLLHPIDSLELSDFVSNLDRINALADVSPGFIWRLKTEISDIENVSCFGLGCIVNLSVWKNVKLLHDYVYRSAHIEVLRERKQWFQKMDEAHMVLWWIPVGHRPTVKEAQRRLQYLSKRGPTAGGFTFKKTFPAPGTDGATVGLTEKCPTT